MQTSRILFELYDINGGYEMRSIVHAVKFRLTKHTDLYRQASIFGHQV